MQIKEHEWVHQLQELKDQVSHERLEWQSEVQILEKQLEDKVCKQSLVLKDGNRQMIDVSVREEKTDVTCG
jgi:hypothetical protein